MACGPSGRGVGLVRARYPLAESSKPVDDAVAAAAVAVVGYGAVKYANLKNSRRSTRPHLVRMLALKSNTAVLHGGGAGGLPPPRKGKTRHGSMTKPGRWNNQNQPKQPSTGPANKLRTRRLHLPESTTKHDGRHAVHPHTPGGLASHARAAWALPSLWPDRGSHSAPPSG